MTQPNSISVQCTQVTTVNVTSNDTDPEGHYPLSLTGVTVTSGGAEAYVASASSIEVTGASAAGTSSATYTVKDSLGASSTGSLTITTTGNQTLCDG